MLLLDDGLASVARAPLDPVIQEGAAVSNPNPSICVCAWLRSVLLKAFELHVISFDMKDFQANLEQLASTIEAAFKVMSGSEALAKSCKEVVDDLKQYWIFLSAAKERPEVRATAAKLALEYLQQEPLKKFYETFQESEFGQQTLSVVKQLIQISSKDEVANSKLARATTILLDDRLPSLLSSYAFGSGYEISNFSLVYDMSVIDTMEESMTLVAESLRLWTPMALESNYDDLNSWLRHLVSNLCFYDECASLYLQALLASSSFGQVLFQPSGLPALGDVKCEKVPNTVNKSMLASIGEMVVDKMIDESSLMEFCENAMKFVSNSLVAHAPHVQVDEHLNKLSTRVMSNMRTREAIAAILTALGDMGEVLPSDADVLDDWVAKKNAGKQGGSFLCIALNLSSMIKEFESLKFARDTQTFTAEMLEDDIKLNTTDGENEEKLIASWSKQFAFLSSFWPWSVWTTCRVVCSG